MEKIIDQPKRFVPIKTYCELSGLSYATVDHMLNSGQLAFITTESGLRRVDTHTLDTVQGSNLNALIVRMETQERLLKQLYDAFEGIGVVIKNTGIKAK